MKYNFLIYISYSYAVPIGNPLEAEIKKRGFNIFWFSDLKDGKKYLRNKENVLDNIKDVMVYKPDIVLTATDDVPDFISGLKVQIFHGFFAKKRPKKNHKFVHFRIRGFFDLYCTQGPSSTIGFLEQAKKHPHFDVIETGWSKVDPLFPIASRNLNEVPTIMIASTFTERLSLAYIDDVFVKIKELSETEKYNFKMVLHPKIPEELIKKWSSLNNDYFTFYNTSDLIPLFKQSDILFADTTSAIQEFILQKKPAITFRHTLKQNYLIQIEEVQEIENAFKEALTYPKELLRNIEHYIYELHPYFDGESSARVIDASISFLHKDKSFLKHKPLNLIRKYKIRKRLNYFTFKSYNRPFTIKN